MSKEDEHKLSKILYYSDIHPSDTEFINNIIYDLQQENQQLKEELEKEKKYNTELMLCNSRFNAILTELEERLKKRINSIEEEKKDWEDDIPFSNWEEQKTCMEEILIRKNEILELEDTLDKIQELKEKYK